MNCDIKLLVLDIDGTIVGESNQISERVKKAIEAAQGQGIKVAIATGRMYNSALRFHRQIGSQMPIIAYNGAWIQDPVTNKLYHHLPVEQSIALELLDYFEQKEWLNHCQINCYINDQLYVSKITPETDMYAKRSGVEANQVEDLRDVISQKPTTKMLAMCQELEIMQRMIDNLKSRYNKDQIYLTQSNYTFFEATHPQANKGTALSYLTEEILGLKPEQVMAIGDNFNDLEMLDYAGFSVAMGNAPEQVQELADWVAPDVEQDGVAVAITRFLSDL